MIEIGRLCVKTAGRDSGKKCVIVDILDERYVLVDGYTRRRKCNIAHLFPLKDIIKIKKSATHGEVEKAFKEIGLDARTTKPRQKTVRPRKKRKTPEQLKALKQERKKIMDILKTKKEVKPKQDTLEEKAGLKMEEAGENIKEVSKEQEPASNEKKAAKPKKAAKKKEDEMKSS